MNSQWRRTLRRRRSPGDCHQ